jgi:MFS family permease
MLALLKGEAQQRGVPSCVLTFEPHPRDYFAQLHQKPDLAPARVGTLRDKLVDLAQCGVDQTVVLPFDARLANQSPQEFIDKVLLTGLGARYVLVGDDFRFGKQRAGDYSLLADHFRGGAIQLGWLESSSGVGIVLGGLLLGIWGGFRRRIFTSLLGVSLMGLCILLLGLTPATMFWLAMAMMFSTGFLQPLTNGPIFAILQATVAPNMQGRVFTVVGSLSAAITPLSLLVAGPIADAVGIQIWYIIGGVACILVGVIAVFIPAVVNIEQSPQTERAVVTEISPLTE